MKQTELAFRQVHLDFHTSPEIDSVGADFDAREFAETLQAAHVDSITCFARCHHGMLYYDSPAFPERIHPHLKNRNMLGEMIQECHRHGIRVPIYTTVQWDQFSAEEHPEWIAVDEHGAWIGGETFDAGFYRTLCVNTPYREFLKEHLRELCTLFDADGIFMDIVCQTECCCRVCRQKMKQEGLNVRNRQDRIGYSQRMIDGFKQEISEFIRSLKNEAGIFYNTSHIGVKQRAVKDVFTHLELESLPSGDWGYIHFPVTMRYARTLGLECVAHTGKFHMEWGDFHSFKNREALEYECFRMLALGSRCLIGDQMEPSGRLSQAVYELIGSVYERVEQVEEWCRNAEPMVDLAVLTPEEFLGGGRAHLPESLMGVENMLDKLGYQFDIIDSCSDFMGYPLLLLPDHIPVDTVLHQKLQAYLASGGRLIATYESGLNTEGTEMVLTEAGVVLTEQTRDEQGKSVRGRLTNQNEYVDYLIPSGVLGKGLPETEHVMYAKGVEVRAEKGTEVLCPFIRPYFDRTYEHFCSHRQTPSSGRLGNPGIVRKKNVIYFASPIFTIYQDRAPKWCKTLMQNAIDLLLPDRWVSHNGPSTVFMALNHQKKHNRAVLHILHYIPEKHCRMIHTVEDVIGLYQLEVKVKAEARPERISLVPQGQELPFRWESGYITVTVPEITGYQIVEISYRTLQRKKGEGASVSR